MKGPLHGGAPSEVVDQLSQVGSPEHAEEWVRDALDRGERLMGFGHRVYRAYDPRAAALRKVAEGMENRPEWLELAIQVEDVVLRVLAEKHPERALKTNVEFYAAPVLMGVGLHARPVPGHVLARAPRRLDGPRPRAGGGQPAHPARTSTTSGPRSATSRPRSSAAAADRLADPPGTGSTRAATGSRPRTTAGARPHP